MVESVKHHQIDKSKDVEFRKNTIFFSKDEKARHSKELYKSWVVPLPSNSHHQDYYILRLGDPELHLHVSLESWDCGQPNINP